MRANDVYLYHIIFIFLIKWRHCIVPMIDSYRMSQEYVKTQEYSKYMK